MNIENQLDNDMLATSITHPRKVAVKCWDVLFSGKSNLGAFTSKIEWVAKKIKQSKTKEEAKKYYDGPKENTNKEPQKWEDERKEWANCFRGDVSEILAEYVLVNYGKNWGIWKYTPFFSINGEDQDVGVDGIGETVDKRNVTVQIKYGSPMDDLDNTERKLRTFHWTSMRKYRVGVDSKDQMFIFTLCGSVNWWTLTRFFRGRLKFIARNESAGTVLHSNDPTGLCSLDSVCDGLNFFESFQNGVK